MSMNRDNAERDRDRWIALAEARVLQADMRAQQSDART